MTTPQSAWQTAAVATNFLKGVRGAMPGAELQFAVIGKIVQEWSSAQAQILDLGCGDGILGRFLLGLYPTARGVFVDFSEPMLEAVSEKLGGSPQASVIQADFSDPRWREAVAGYPAFDIVISGFAIHHLPDARKRALYAEIYTRLAPGGIFLNMEHVSSQTPAGTQLFDEFFIDHLHAFHAQADPSSSREQVANTYYHRPDKVENKLAPVDEQCRWLREIGFQDVDCFFKVFELALFGGRVGR